MTIWNDDCRVDLVFDRSEDPTFGRRPVEGRGETTRSGHSIILGPARVDVVRRSLTPTLSRGERELVLTDLLSHYLQYL